MSEPSENAKKTDEVSSVDESAMRDLALKLTRRAKSVSDPELRVGFARAEFLRLEPTQAADLIIEIVYGDGTGPRPSGVEELITAIAIALADPQCTDLRLQAALVASERGHVDAARILTPDTTVDASLALQVPDFGKGRTLTLGERKSLARTHDRTLILRAIRDPHPDVISILLGNRRLTEADVIRMCSARPIHPDVLRTVVRSTRWCTRYRVRRTVVYNPYTPLDMALWFSLLLKQQDAKDVIQSQAMRPEIRELCKQTLESPILYH